MVVRRSGVATSGKFYPLISGIRYVPLLYSFNTVYMAYLIFYFSFWLMNAFSFNCLVERLYWLLLYWIYCYCLGHNVIAILLLVVMAWCNQHFFSADALACIRFVYILITNIIYGFYYILFSILVSFTFLGFLSRYSLLIVSN